MSKLETARQLAKQTDQQFLFMGTSQQEPTGASKINPEPEKELTDFMSAIKLILETALVSQQLLKKLKQKMIQVERDHWKQVWMLIFFNPDISNTLYHDTFDLNIQIADDVDDEAVLGM